MLAACEEVPACYEEVETFALTEPSGASSLTPGGTVRLVWDPPDVQGAVVAFVLVDGDARVPVGGGDTALGMYEVSTDDRGMAIPPAVYRIQGIFGGCALSAEPYDAGPTRLVFVQGVTFVDAALTITAADVPRDITVTTVSLSSFDLELLVDPTPGSAGDELSFTRNNVPGELVEMTRRYAFTGTTTTGGAIPAGTYRLVARVHPGFLPAYDVVGPQLAWQP